MIKLINTMIFIKHVLNKKHLLLLHPFLDLVNVIESTKSLAFTKWINSVTTLDAVERILDRAPCI